MSQTKKVPLRKCTGCNEVKNKKDMIRVIRDKEGNILWMLRVEKMAEGHTFARM